jgi:hypothetical protein
MMSKTFAVMDAALGALVLSVAATLLGAPYVLILASPYLAGL